MKAKTTKATTKTPPRATAQSASGQGIGARIAFLRRQQAISLEDLARKSGLTKSFLSKLERGLSVPSISTAMALAESFDLTVGQLMGEQQYDDAICVVRKGDRRSFMRRGSEVGYNYEMLAAGKRFKMMEPYIMRPPLVFQDARRFEHAGQEVLETLRGGRCIPDDLLHGVGVECGELGLFDAALDGANFGIVARPVHRGRRELARVSAEYRVGALNDFVDVAHGRTELCRAFIRRLC